MNIEQFKSNHKFFIKESYNYMKGTNRISYYLKYPFAYLKFMYLMNQTTK